MSWWIVKFVRRNLIYIVYLQQQRLLLKLKKPKNDKQVQWDSKTVDNEHMDKKKSKCKINIIYNIVINSRLADWSGASKPWHLVIKNKNPI